MHMVSNAYKSGCTNFSILLTSVGIKKKKPDFLKHIETTSFYVSTYTFVGIAGKCISKISEKNN